MRILVLAKEEMVLLSLLYGKPYNSFSVMKDLNHYDTLEEVMSKEDYIKSANGFVRDGLLGFDHEKKIRPTRETILLFDTINSPQKTFIILNQLKPDIGTVYYCEKNGFGVLITISPNKKNCVVNYPFNREMLGNWIDKEVVGEIDEEKEEFELKSFEISQIAHLHFMVLVAYTNFLRGLPKHNPELKFQLESIENPMFINQFDDFNQLINLEKLGDLYNKEEAKGYLDELIGSGLINNQGNMYQVNPHIANVFDPDEFRGIIRVNEHNPFGRGKTLYTTRWGYLMMEEVKYEPLTMKIDILPLAIDKKSFAKSFLEFSDLRLTEEMKEKLKAKLTPKA